MKTGVEGLVHVLANELRGRNINPSVSEVIMCAGVIAPRMSACRSAHNSVQERLSRLGQRRESQIMAKKCYDGKVRRDHGDRAWHNARWLNPAPRCQDGAFVAGAVDTRTGPRRNTRMSSARNIASRSSFAQRSLRSRWKIAFACTGGWKISSCPPRKLLLHNQKEWRSYGNQATERCG